MADPGKSFTCVSMADEGKADIINHPAKESCTKIEAGQSIIRIRKSKLSKELIWGAEF